MADQPMAVRVGSVPAPLRNGTVHATRPRPTPSRAARLLAGALTTFMLLLCLTGAVVLGVGLVTVLRVLNSH